ncbi:MAG: FprA family A-type flavoprotein [Synergistales bacterium]|nr:FprA family A-type flavoprotein [Synergistales bacterium]
MNHSIKVTHHTYWLGANDHQTDLFESLWPLPKGVTYNCYLIDDEKTALIDTVKGPFLTQLVEKLKGLLGERPLDYLVVNHMEPDHSGAIKLLRCVYPQLKIIGNVQTKGMLENFYALTENIQIVKDGDTLDLGKHTLSFHLVPMVHWPETMVTYDHSTKTLFSCDAFGGFGSLDGGLFDDELDMQYYEDEVLRYFSNIVGRYSPQVQKAIEKLKGLDISIVAPSHGPIHRKNPGRIITLYDRWSRNETECGAVIVFGSMYGNTQKMAETVARAMAEEGIEKMAYHDISRSHVSYVVKDIWKYKGLILASCTYNTTLFPPMADLIMHLKNKMMKGRMVGILGSYSWSKGALAELQNFADSGDWELVQPTVEVKSAPFEEDLEKCMELGRKMAQKMKMCYVPGMK